MKMRNGLWLTGFSRLWRLTLPHPSALFILSAPFGRSNIPPPTHAPGCLRRLSGTPVAPHCGKTLRSAHPIMPSLSDVAEWTQGLQNKATLVPIHLPSLTLLHKVLYVNLRNLPLPSSPQPPPAALRIPIRPQGAPR